MLGFREAGLPSLASGVSVKRVVLLLRENTGSKHPPQAERGKQEARKLKG